MNDIKRWSVIGIIAITILGSCLHYVYAWTGHSTIIGAFVPVNESVWEHLKMGYWSVVLFSVAEYFLMRHSINNYFPAKTVGVLALELAILLIFYGYCFMAGKDNLLIDIFSYVLGAILCQYLTYGLFRYKPVPVLFKRISLVVFISTGVLFAVTTYYPPHWEIFKDGNDNTYGIAKEK